MDTKLSNSQEFERAKLTHSSGTRLRSQLDPRTQTLRASSLHLRNTTMSEPVNSVALNNEAVALMLDRGHREAISVLRAALASLVEGLAHAEVHSSSHKLGSSLEPEHLGDWELESVAIPHAVCRNNPTAVFSCFMRAFRLPEEGVSVTSHRHLVSAVLLYNLGLAIIGSSTDRSEEMQLQAALQIYSHALGVMSIQLAIDPAHLTKKILVMALVNNLGHVHSRLLHMEEAERYHCCLSSMLADTPRSSHFEFFYMTVVFYRHMKVNTAPAA